MAKVQTRRTVSLSGSVYNAAKLAAEARGTSLSQFVTDLLRNAGVEVSVTAHVAMLQAQHEKALLAVHERKQEQRLHEAEARRLAVLRRQREEAAERSPCRRERCGILGLHPAHDEDAA